MSHQRSIPHAVRGETFSNRGWWRRRGLARAPPRDAVVLKQHSGWTRRREGCRAPTRVAGLIGTPKYVSARLFPLGSRGNAAPSSSRGMKNRAIWSVASAAQRTGLGAAFAGDCHAPDGRRAWGAAPHSRRGGLPISSAPMESLVKQARGSPLGQTALGSCCQPGPVAAKGCRRTVGAPNPACGVDPSCGLC